MIPEIVIVPPRRIMSYTCFFGQWKLLLSRIIPMRNSKATIQFFLSSKNKIISTIEVWQSCDVYFPKNEMNGFHGREWHHWMSLTQSDEDCIDRSGYNLHPKPYPAAVERIRHIYDSQGQMLALFFR